MPGEELTPEGADSAKGVDAGRGVRWRKKDSNVMLAITRPAFFGHGFCAPNAFLALIGQLLPDFIKDRFKCRDMRNMCKQP